jgi:hypothetical protein
LLTRRHRRFYAKSVNCCAEVVDILNAGPDGGSCLIAADCRGFKGTCADLVQQFSNLAVLPDYPNGLTDYACHAVRRPLPSSRGARAHSPDLRSLATAPPAVSRHASLFNCRRKLDSSNFNGVMASL